MSENKKIIQEEIEDNTLSSNEELDVNIAEDDVSMSNIFDNFEVDEDIKETLEEKKDFLYYINYVWIVFRTFNLIFLMVIIFTWVYIFIQKSDSNKFESKDYLNPICDILSWTGNTLNYDFLWNNCSSITILNNKIDKEIIKNQKQILLKLVKYVKMKFQSLSIKNSPQVIFALDKTKNKQKIISIFDDFDILKNKFTWIEVSKIQCGKFTIKDNLLELKCFSFSKWWDSNIPWFNGLEVSRNNLNGSSITLASSFINFIEKSWKFMVLDKQKTFNKIPYFWEWPYNYKTEIKLKLKHISTNILN